MSDKKPEVSFESNPAKVLREMLDNPAIRKHVAATHGLPEDFEIDEDSFKAAEAKCDEQDLAIKSDS